MNDVYLKGKIKNIKTGEGQYGKWGFATIVVTKKVQDKEYQQFIPCIANKYNAERLETLTDDDWVIAQGSLKVSKNKRTEQWEMKVNLRSIDYISFKQAQFTAPQEQTLINQQPQQAAPTQPQYQDDPGISDADIPF
jgi:hypothetical protein